MLLTPKDIRYIEICRLRAEGKTYEQITEDVGVQAATIAKATRYGERYGLFNQIAAKKLAETIARLRKHGQWLERKLRDEEAIVNERKRKRRQGETTRGKPALASGIVSQYHRMLLETEMQIAKLEGLYEETVNLRHSGSVDTRVQFYLPDNGRDGGD